MRWDWRGLLMGLWDFISGSSRPSRTWAGPGHNWTFDWCRFRRDNRCYFTGELDQCATELAGYAVWIPRDRGYCPRIKWDDQEQCPVGEPGPHVPGGYLDATVSWDSGGQRNGIPTPPHNA